ncbi:dapper homolog 2 [Megalops cyprinoides]|uniref:dapper homolog 2 n=1 Tax=Megalops cyprinoides TaxID=118141 RepID=UPI001864B9CE|nr:dapper homolog 2 [Megalops cyprinoides]
MLSRKVSGAGLLSTVAGIDRGRVGERLQAALAGLQELHFLKERQGDKVFWALRMDRDETVSQPSAENPELGTEEQRLEATLTALKQQLSRLRRQDVGLKSHLQQLDQQISELKLDVCKVSTEQLESDSRPSSGFYDLSDGGSGSLSNSCTSVYSECLSSSQSNLHPTPCPPGPSPHCPPGHPEASRRRSADESAAQAEQPRGGGVRLGSSWIRTGTAGADRARQRPVSTGDLDRMLIPGLGFYKSADTKKPSLSHNIRSSVVNPKFQNNLVSRSGTEVYHYPSPLHAVALQSPIFSLSGDVVTPGAGDTPGTQDGATPDSDSMQWRPGCTESRPVSYINKLLKRRQGKVNLQSEAGRDQAQPPMRSHTEATAGVTRGSGLICGLASRMQEHSLHQRSAELLTECSRLPQAPNYGQELVSSVSHASNMNHIEEVVASCHYAYQAARESNPKDVTVTAPPGQSTRALEEGSRNSQVGGDTLRGEVLDRKAAQRRAGPARSSSTEEGRVSEGPLSRTAQPEFVHAQFVPAGSQRVKVRQADRKMKAVRLRKKSCEKLRVTKQLHLQSETGKEAGFREHKQAGAGRVAQRQAGSAGDGGGQSCSESSLSGSTLPNHSRLQPQFEPGLRPNKAHRAQKQECVPADPGRRKQVARKWQSAVEISARINPAGSTQGQRARETQTQGASRRAGMVRSVSARPRSGQWGHPSLNPTTSSSHLRSYSSRYPPAPFPAQRSRYPPRSESELSEYSADCTSLFHSTIAESSEGELSDFTANRFGDSESSHDSQSSSESDSSLSLEEGDEEEEEEGGLVWAEAALGPTAAGLSLHQPRPEPPACRIKASRALKKKIRRFEPAALKVMTLV